MALTVAVCDENHKLEIRRADNVGKLGMGSGFCQANPGYLRPFRFRFRFHFRFFFFSGTNMCDCLWTVHWRALLKVPSPHFPSCNIH